MYSTLIVLTDLMKKIVHLVRILAHMCCISSFYTVMVYIETVIFSAVDIECSGPVVW